MRRLAMVWVAGALAACGGGEPAARTELVVYTAIEAEELPGLKQAFEAAHPDIVINWVRESTGIITARLLAEKERPQADVVWGVAVSSVMLLKQQGLLESYLPEGAARLDPRFVDAEPPATWTGNDAFESAICVNTVEIEKRKLPMPATWADLAKPAYEGHLAMPNPSSSGTGFLTVVGWLQLMGEKQGWAYMDRLHENMARYTHSGSKPCKEVAAGEVAVAIGLGFTAAKQKGKGAPISIVHPAEGVGWDMEANAIVKGTEQPAAAKRLIDFAVSRQASELYNKAYPVVAYPGVAQPVPHYPADVASKMMKMDFAWAASHRARILAEWQNRYDAKSEPKN